MTAIARYCLYLFLSLPLAAAAQVEVAKTPFSWLNVRNDRRYIEDHTRDLTVRLFATSKFSRYVIGNTADAGRLVYASNDNLSLGAGANWRFIGLNFAFKMPLVNNDYARFGRTRSFDLQTFCYFRKLQLDIYVQSYNGLYIANRSILARPRTDMFPYRPDMQIRNYGLNAQYIFNNRRFSYRAAFLQNEFQKKSAGSVVLGGAIYHFRAAADSAIMPADITYADPFWKQPFNRTNVTSLSLNIGYAYTLVLLKNLFITASITAGPGLNYTDRKDQISGAGTGGFDYQLNGTMRLAAGYNSSNFFAGVQYLRLMNRNGMPDPAAFQQFETGNFRVTLARRIKLSKRTERQMLQVIENVKDEVEEVIR